MAVGEASDSADRSEPHYQFDSRLDEANSQAIRTTRLVWRMSPQRLDAEALRDSMRAVSGLLELTPPVGSAVARMGEGPSLSLFPGGAGGRMTRAVDDTRDNHRSVYLAVVRDYPSEAMSLFDAADAGFVVAQRQTTTVPAQSLYMLNGSFSQRVAEAAAGRIDAAGASDDERITAATTFWPQPTAGAGGGLWIAFLRRAGPCPHTG
jgi:hypothetical protein